MPPLPPGARLIIEKRNEEGELVVSYPGWLVQNGDPILILARWHAPDLALPYVTFAQGDLLLEAYYRQRPYNVFALYDGREIPETDWGAFLARAQDDALPRLCRQLPNEALKGLYINFTRPVRFDPGARRLAWFDLALDIWTPARGQPLVLDEADYQALNLDAREPELARAIEEAKRDILAGRLPLSPCQSPNSHSPREHNI